MKRLNKQSFVALGQDLQVLAKGEMIGVIAGNGDGTQNNPYSWEQMESMMDAGTWAGGFVVGDSGLGYMPMGCVVYGYYGGNQGNSNSEQFWANNPWISSIFSDITSELVPPVGYAGTASNISNIMSDTSSTSREKILQIAFELFFGMVPGGSTLQYAAQVGAEKINEFRSRVEYFFSDPWNWTYGNYGYGNYGNH